MNNKDGRDGGTCTPTVLATAFWEPHVFCSITSPFLKMVVLSGNAPDSYASPAINFVISKAAFFKLQDHFKW